MKNEFSRVTQKLNMDGLDKLGIGQIRRGLRMKFIISIVIALLISPTIANFLYNLANSSGLIPASFAVVLATAINLIVVTSIVLFLVVRFVIRPLNEVITVAVAIAEGNLTQKSNVKNRDEIGRLSQAIDSSVDKMNVLLTDIKGVGDNVVESSENLSSMTAQFENTIDQMALSINEAASDNSRQSSNIIEATSSLKELSAGVRATASRAIQISESAAGTLQGAIKGEKAVEQTIQEMQSITNDVQESVTEVNNLKDQIYKIADILSAITAISTQTNLLALNAAIEAARAGEQGRGFAVVAEEVRKLAEQSSEAAAEIESIVNNILVKTNETSSSIEAISKDTEQGLKVVAEMGEIFKSIMNSVETDVRDIKTIADLIDNQALQADQLVAVMDDIAAVSQNVAAVFEEVAASTQEQTASLAEIANMSKKETQLAEHLKSKISVFKLN